MGVPHYHLWTWLLIKEDWQALLSSSYLLVASVGLTAFFFLDFSRLFASSWPNRGCRLSVDCQCRSLLLAALRRISGGAMPERMYRLSVGVGLRQPVTRQQVALMAGLIFFSVNWSLPYCTCILAVNRRVLGVAPQLVPVSLLMMLFLAQTFAFVFSTWASKDRQRSRVTPRYTGWSQLSSGVPDQVTFSWQFASWLHRWKAHACAFVTELTKSI